ncbi:serine--tRNA ligase [Candidatus Woesebacteria bacterium RBG_16_36_11]|uniref:Serine--tRNA ligase n=3 Tax=Candidatus Woeseibacteriota TaxID=1752722 RepID=A0A1F7X8A4_9BACT|nr:MAG: serine--tRNA ligase [Candidatus Woesebacteria bacterium RBG_13_36_22]OGM11270.1 MAG: serine--tRNA ligase [Candidatus Woesebacteria bacterium RBG_16_36_11]OGM17520.1 MAG: serine--tRNA ligase [Candidatus Woesebacteria bacterium RBG_19FT_COMBO_37_29]
MLDINFIKENPEKVKAGLKKRLFKDLNLVDKAISLFEEKKALQVEVENLRGQKNKAADAKDIEEGKKIKSELTSKESKLSEVDNKLNVILSGIPNLPDEDVPEGPEENKKHIKKVGNPKKFDFKPKDHLDLGTSLGIIDVERAAKISGSRFTYLKGDGALLEFALINFALEKLIKEGFTPVMPPMLIKKEITDGLGYWSGGGNENYYYVMDFDKEEGGKELENPLYLVGTGEHSIVPMHKDEILEAKELPKKYVAFSSCFRREAGSYGKDTKGILRVHQFDKVEMVVFSKPDESEKVLKQMLKISEDLMQELGLPYQVVELAAGDIGFPSAKTFDIETWMPGQEKYRETHSISTTTDYQARRLNIKYKDSERNKFVYILNGTAFAIGRTIIAILENYQNAGGSITIPEVLRKWMGKDLIK